MAASPKPKSKSEDYDDLPAVVFRCSFRNTVLDALRAKESWEETTSDVEWDINWADVGWIREHFDSMRMDEHQRVNHFRNHFELTRKDLLVKNINRMRKQLEKMDRLAEAERYGFLPISFVLPGDYSLYVEAFRRHPGETWIMKPIGRAQGRGIFLINKLSQISQWKRDHRWRTDTGGRSDRSGQAEAYVVQRYLRDPYTIGGKKFDMRLYALVTSFTPLVVWLYRSGFARFSGTRYSSDRADTDNLEMHLTNVAVQKKSEGYDASVGCKWHVKKLKLFLASKHGLPAVNRLFQEIEHLIVRSLLACQKTIIQDKHCFELYGYDVLIDRELRPWLIEVNASPSLTADTDEDYRLKRALIADTMDVVDVEGNRDGEETTVGGFDLVYQAGPVDHPLSCAACPSPLGRHNPTEHANLLAGMVKQEKPTRLGASTPASVAGPATGGAGAGVKPAGAGGSSPSASVGSTGASSSSRTSSGGMPASARAGASAGRGPGTVRASNGSAAGSGAASGRLKLSAPVGRLPVGVPGRAGPPPGSGGAGSAARAGSKARGGGRPTGMPPVSGSGSGAKMGMDRAMGVYGASSVGSWRPGSGRPGSSSSRGPSSGERETYR